MIALRVLYLAALLLGVGYLVEGSGHALGTVEMPGDGVFPVLVGVVFAILSLIALIQSLLPGKGPGYTATIFPRGANLRRVFSITISLALFAALFRVLGFYICAFALMSAVLRILSPWGWLKIVLVSLFLLFLSYLLFHQLLGVPLPKGFLWT